MGLCGGARQVCGIVALVLAWSVQATAQTTSALVAPPGSTAVPAPLEPAAASVTDAEQMDARLAQLEEALRAQAATIEAQDQKIEALSASAQAAEATALSAEEAATAAMAAGDEEPVQEESAIRLYGFADMSFTKLYVNREGRFGGLIDRDSKFAMGNVNLYVDANPSRDFRFLTEVRLTLFPHGDIGDDFSYVDTSTYDQTSATGRNRLILSSIVMERAYIEWKKYDAFKVLAGYFLTPYGIWNVDHGSPTLISSVLPSFWASEYFPTRQAGVQVLGEVFHKSWEYGYRAYVSNGRVDRSQVETDPFKMVGGRVYARHTGEIGAQIGASGFWNRDAANVRTVESFDPFVVSKERTSQYEEYGVAGDASIEVGKFRALGEFVLNQQEYVDGLREAGPGGAYFHRDQVRWNAYNTLAYRLPWIGLEPFTFIEYANRPSSADNSSWVLSAGVIEHLAPGTQLKFQAFHVLFPDDETFPDASRDSFPGWDFRLVTAF